MEVPAFECLEESQEENQRVKNEEGFPRGSDP